MTKDFATAMRRSLELTRAGDLSEATRAIQSALGRPGGGASPATVPAEGQVQSKASRRPATEGEVEDAEVLGTTPPRRPLGAVIAGLARARRGSGRVPRRTAPTPALPRGASFERRRFDGPPGGRDYRLYVPANRADGVRGLILMLHGCTQTPEDFAAGTAMNARAERHGFIVAWPEQTRAQNAQLCWNWFRPSDQAAAGGEPAILAALAGQLAREFDVPDRHVFAAGLSAGGAMAAILGLTHPEAFRAVGVHSGLAAGSAHDVVSAFAAMRGEAGQAARGVGVPAIVFQGSADATVAPGNADRIAGPLTGAATRSERVSGRDCRVTTGRSVEGRDVEIWRIEGAGHAWSGGTPDGSYSDPSGPDASELMIQFFEAQAKD